MQISDIGLLLIKQSEGYRKCVYKDCAGYPTIGYGHKLLPGEEFPDGLTQAEADLMLRGDLKEVEAAIEKLVTVPLTQGQYDALCSFIYNLGQGAFQTSTFRKMLNMGQYQQAALQILRWDHANGQEVDGLRTRRKAEFTLFHS